MTKVREGALLLAALSSVYSHAPKLQAQACSVYRESNQKIGSHALQVHQIERAVLFHSKMEIDVDGAPNAYAPNDVGLDYNRNAKNGNSWVGVATDNHGNPLVQTSGPYKGYYVSVTSLHDGGDFSDPHNNVDATKIPYIALSPYLAKQLGIVLGDLAVVTSQVTGEFAYALYADVGPTEKVGEGSLALATSLGFPHASPRTGGVSGEFIFLIFPKSGLGQGRVRTLDEIRNAASRLYVQWGGANQLSACLASEK